MKTKRTTPPIEVRSPALERSFCFFETRYDDWFCIDHIAARVSVPDEEGPYWVVARTHQWRDERGLAVELRISRDGNAYYRDDLSDGWRYLCKVNIPKLRKLGVKRGGPPMTIYWCLLTEVDA